MEIIEWLMNQNFLGGAWNIVGVTVNCILLLFTFYKLEGYALLPRFFLSLSMIATLVAYVDLVGTPAFFFIFGVGTQQLAFYFTTKAQQILTLVTGTMLVWHVLKAKLNFHSWISKAGLLTVFTYIVVPSMVTHVIDYRKVTPAWLSEQYYLLTYIPCWIIWAITYIGLWRKKPR